MTRTVAWLASVEITPVAFALRDSFNSMPRKCSPVTDACTDERRVFADASCEDKCVQSTECGGEGTDPLFRLIAEQRHSLRCPHVVGFVREQIPHIGTPT